MQVPSGGGNGLMPVRMVGATEVWAAGGSSSDKGEMWHTTDLVNWDSISTTTQVCVCVCGLPRISVFRQPHERSLCFIFLWVILSHSLSLSLSLSPALLPLFRMRLRCRRSRFCHPATAATRRASSFLKSAACSKLSSKRSAREQL